MSKYLTQEGIMLMERDALNDLCEIMKTKKPKHQTVGEIISILSKFDPNLPIVMTLWESLVTDSGTEMGGNTDYQLEICDMETRIEITQGDRAKAYL